MGPRSIALLSCVACTAAPEPKPAAKVEPPPKVEPAPNPAPEPRVEPEEKIEPRVLASPLLAPADVLREATVDLRFVSREKCAAPSMFRTFTTEPARWVSFANAWGRASAMTQCTDLAMTVRVDLYPASEPNRRYAVFFVESGLAVEELQGETWVRICDGPCEADIAEVSRAAWNAGYDLRELARAMSTLERAVKR